MPPQDLVILRALLATERDFLRAVRRGAGFDKRSVLAATDPIADPIVSAKLIRRPLSFLAGLFARLFCILLS
jgi:hypothetical protein